MVVVLEVLEFAHINGRLLPREIRAGICTPHSALGDVDR